MVEITQLDDAGARSHQDDLARLLHENYRIGFPESAVGVEYAREKIRGLIGYLERHEAIVYGAMDQGRLVGFLWGVRRQVFSATRYHINELIVSAECRGQGIGRRLVEAYVAEASRAGVDGVDLFCSKSNAAAVGFYESLGFEVERYHMCLKRKT